MSYKVQYDPEMDRRYPSQGFKSRKLKNNILLCSLAVLAVGFLFVRSGLVWYFIPGDPEVTTAAFTSLVERVGNGENVTDAIMAFCSEIIRHSS